MPSIPWPRLLPVTITAMALLALVKCAVLLIGVIDRGGDADGVIVTAARAAAVDTPAMVTPPAATAPAAAAPPVSDSEKTLLLDLRQRRAQLDALAESLAARESLLSAAERKIAARVAELRSLQQKLEGMDEAQKQKVEAGWQGMVKLYEAMKPKEAAAIFNDLSMSVLLQVMDRMKDARAALIMAAMALDKARDVTAELARLRTGPEIRAAAADQPGATSTSN